MAQPEVWNCAALKCENAVMRNPRSQNAGIDSGTLRREIMKINRVASGLFLISMIFGLWIPAASQVPPLPSSGPAPALSLVVTPTSAVGGTGLSGTATLSFSLAGPNSPATYEINLTSSNPAATVPQTLTLLKRDTRTYSARFQINLAPVSAATPVTIGASFGGSSKTASLTVQPPSPISLDLRPATVRGGVTASGTIRFNGPAPAGGLSIPLSISDPTIAQIADVTLREGQQTASFQVTTKAVAAETNLTISLGSETRLPPVALKLTPPIISRLSVNPVSVFSGVTANGSVTLDGPAPAEGLTIPLSSNGAAATLAQNVIISGGQQSADFQISTSVVPADTQITVTAGQGITAKSVSFSIKPIALSTITINPSTVTGGATVTGELRINAPAPAGGFVIPLAGSHPNAATFGGSVSVPAGQQSATFQISANPVSVLTPVTITAGEGATAKSATLSVVPPTIKTFTLSATEVEVNNTTTATVVLTGPPKGAVTVPVSISPALGTLAAFTVDITSETHSFGIRADHLSVNDETTYTITLGTGADAKTASLLVRVPPKVESITFNPGTLRGGENTTATVTLNRNAYGPGAQVSLTSMNDRITVPSSISIPAGQRSATFAVTTKAVASRHEGNNVIKAMSGPAAPAHLGSLTLTPPSITAFTCAETQLVAGRKTVCTVKLDGRTPISSDNFAVTMTIGVTSSNQNVAYPQAARFTSNQDTSNTFDLTTFPVTADTPVVLTAGEGADQRSINFTVKAVAVDTLTVSNYARVTGGLRPTLSVTLNAPAPAGGTVVSLSSSHPEAVPVPASVSFSLGQMSQNVTLHTKPVATETVVTITTTGVSEKSIQVTVVPPVLSTLQLSNQILPAGATSSGGTVRLNGETAAGSSVTIPLTSSDATVTVPSSVTIPAGSSEAGFQMSLFSVSSDTQVTITAGQGADAKSSGMTLRALALDSISALSSALNFAALPITIKLNGTAGPGGFTVPLSSNNPSVLAVPASAVIPSGQQQFVVPGSSSRVDSDTTVTITAGEGSGAKVASVTVKPFGIQSLAVNPQTVSGGTTITAQVEINHQAPDEGFVVPLSSSASTAVVPPNVTIPANQRSVTFQITTTAVEADTVVTITAGQGANTKTTNILVRKP